jgi:hypothetical protein
LPFGVSANACNTACEDCLSKGRDTPRFAKQPEARADARRMSIRGHLHTALSPVMISA